MLPAFLIYFLIISCNSVTDRPRPEVKSKQDIKPVNIVDSTNLIDSLYRDATVLKEVRVDSCNCSHEFNTINKRIEIKCVAQFNKHVLRYMLILTDTASNYRRDGFEPSDEFRYDSAYIVLDEKKIPVTQLKYSNNNSVVEPVNVWYSSGFGPVGKYYLLPDKREVLLMRGLNFYCNGTHCSNYKIFILQRFKDGATSVACLDYPGNFPYCFENTFLFYPAGSSKLSIYTVKKGKTGERTSDFEIMDL